MLTFNYLLLSLVSLSSINTVVAIVNGKSAVRGQFKYMAKIDMKFSGECSGAIISDRHVLTAGHCVHRQEPHKITVTVGSSDLDMYPAIIVDVLKAHVHPEFYYELEAMCIISFCIVAACECFFGPIDFRLQPENDIAILLLTKKLTLGSNLQRVHLPTVSHPPECSADCYVAGWGILNDYATETTKILQWAKLRIVDAKQCLEKGTRYRDQGEFCAVDENDETYLGPGDSGGPLVCDNVVYGIVSAGQRMKPGIFAEVYHFMAFIYTKIKEDIVMLNQMKKSMTSLERFP